MPQASGIQADFRTGPPNSAPGDRGSRSSVRL